MFFLQKDVYNIPNCMQSLSFDDQSALARMRPTPRQPPCSCHLDPLSSDPQLSQDCKGDLQVLFWLSAQNLSFTFTILEINLVLKNTLNTPYTHIDDTIICAIYQRLKRI